MIIQTPFYSKSLTYRPICSLSANRERLGNKNNTNFKYDNGSLTIDFPTFYLTEIPTITVNYESGDNTGAAFASFITEMSNGNAIIETIKNMGQGNIPSIMAGNNTFRIIKEGCYISLKLNTRIFFDEGEGSNYSKMFDYLLRITMPSSATKSNSSKLADDFMIFADGVTEIPGKCLGKLIDSASENLSISKVTDYVGSVVEAGVGTIGNLTENDPAERSKNKQSIERARVASNELGTSMGDFVEGALEAIPSHIYKEYVTVKITNDNGNILGTLLNNLQFRLTGFESTQSQQTVGDTLFPIYMDFEMNLESLGKINNLWELEHTV